MSFLTLQLQKLQLSGGGATSTAVSITLESMKLIDGTTNVTIAMFGDIGYITLEPATSKEEQISFTGITQNASGTATLTGVVRGLAFESPYAETSANKKSHSGSVTCVVSNTSAFYSQFAALKNDDTYTGTKTHTNFPVKSGTTTPTSADHFATKAYVDAVGAGTAVYDQNIIQAIAGESLVAGDPIHFKVSDQKWHKTSAAAAATSLNVKIGIAQSVAAADAAVNVLIGGLDKTQSGMTPGAPQFLGDTNGTLVETPGAFEKFVGWAVDATDLMLSVETVTADEKDALAGISGITPDTDNKFVDNADTTIAAVQTATTIAFVDSNPDTITDSGNGFITAGFKVGDSITISGSASNNSTFTIAAVVAGTITLITADTLVVEGAGASVTITAATASKVVRLKSDSSLPALDGSNLTGINTDIQTFTGSGTYTKPAGAKKIFVQGWGAGGGGGSATDSAADASAAGGGGGAYIEVWFDASDVGATETITIGAGGTPGAAGGNSTFGSLATAFGGGGGLTVTDGTDSGGGGGGGSTSAGATATSGTGGAGGGPNGGVGTTSTGESRDGLGGASGGGDAGAGPGAAGGDAGYGGGGGGASDDNQTSAAGGDSVHGGAGGGGGSATGSAGPGGTSLNGGNGGAGGLNAPGTAGTAPGGGGGGGGSTSGLQLGGEGADGQIIVTTFL